MAMRKFAFVSSMLLAGIYMYAQSTPFLPIVNLNVPSGTLTLQATYEIFTPYQGLGPVLIYSTAEVDFIAGERIHLGPGVHAGSFSGNGYFHAQIGVAPAFDVVFIEPNEGYPHVEQYEKLEMGIRLPQAINDAVEAFCNEDPNAVTLINPFNPEELNVEARFEYYNTLFGQWVTLPTVYGFYYREYERDISNGDPANWDWNQVADQYTFRVRFAPPVLGPWKVKIDVSTPSTGVLSVSEIRFECIAPIDPNNLGFVKVNSGDRYMSLGNRSFIPIGQNLPMMGQTTGLDDPSNGQGSYGWKTVNPSAFIEYNDRVAYMASQGANYFRMVSFPWAHDIEFEKLNDYSDRLTVAREMDWLLDVAKQNNIYLHWSLHWFLMINHPYHNVYWDWNANSCDEFPTDNGYCYGTELGLATPADFLTDADAKKFYKYRLRYIMSRWGYSRNLAVVELFGEANQISQEYSCVTSELVDYPYEYDVNFRDNLRIWQNEMLTYLQANNSETHIITFNFRDSPAGDDNSYDVLPGEIATFNHYRKYLDRVEMSVFRVPELSGSSDRPLLFSETGAPEMDDCSNDCEWIRTFWSVPFSGAAGGLNWPKQTPSTYVYSHFNRLRDVLDGIDFNDGEWEAGYDVRSDFLAETVHLKKLIGISNSMPQYNKAVGVVMARAYNAFSMRNCSTTVNCNCTDFPSSDSWGPIDYYNLPNASIYYPLQNVQHGPLGNRLKLTGMGAYAHYWVEWYDVMTGQFIQSDDKYAQFDGELVLEFPDLVLENNPLRPILAFRIHRYDETMSGRIAHQDPMLELSDTDVTRPENQKIPGVWNLYPNPANNYVELLPPNNEIVFSLSLLSPTGCQVLTIPDRSGPVTLDISLLAEGAYILHITSAGILERRKLIIAR